MDDDNDVSMVGEIIDDSQTDRQRMKARRQRERTRSSCTRE